LNNAEWRLQTLWDEAEKRQDTEDKMSRAEKAEDIEALATSIKWAEEVGVSQNVALLMTGNLAKLLAKVLERAEHALIHAGMEECTEAFEAAISQAEQVGVNNQALAKAREKLQVLLEEAHKKQEAMDACVKAAEGIDIEVLAVAIVSAKELGIGEEALKMQNGICRPCGMRPRRGRRQKMKCPERKKQRTSKHLQHP